MSDSENVSDLKKPSNPYSFLFRLLHWVLSISAVILFLTGVSLHAGTRPEWSVFGGAVPNWLWEGRVYLWHFWAAIVFVPSIVAVAVIGCKRRIWRKLTQVLLIGGSLTLVVTGVLMMYPCGPVPFMKVVVGLHAALGLIIVPFALIWHIWLGLTRHVKFLVPSFHPLQEPSWKSVAIFAVPVIVSTIIFFAGWPLVPSQWQVEAVRIDATGEEIEDVTILPWEKSDPMTVRLMNGAGFDSGQTDLTIQALHNGDELFMKFEWDDPKADFNYWPWRKTEDGWEYLQTSTNDETVYYEDKFSLVFPIAQDAFYEPTGCANYCHLDSDYGWGYKGGQDDVDVWHWKASRTGTAGFLDDKYWSEVDLEAKDIGRHGDPNDGGGYAKNYDPEIPHPLFLPNEAAPRHYGVMFEDQAIAYTDEAGDAIEPGTIIPGLVVAPYTGDRADVSVVSDHSNGRWTLYARRKLNTGNEHDLLMEPGGTYPFGAAAFDCAAKRHAYSMPVLELVVAE
jgi:hypothetical protein